MRRACLVGLLAILGIVVMAPRASAHGVLETSQPANREVLNQPPEAVTMRFTEPPVLRFSSVQVLDRFGGSFVGGGLETTADEQTLRLRLRPLPKGVYTVNWRIVSSVDGHATSGSFAFGVGEPVTDAATRPAASSPNRGSVLSVSGRFLFYAGMTGLVGTAWVGALAFRGRRRSLTRLLASAWTAAAFGLVALTFAQREVAGSSVGFFDVPLGGAILWRAAGILTAAAGLVVAWRGGARRWQLGLGLLATGAAGAIVAHVQSGHAAAASWPWAMVALQGAHFLAAAAWIGGLAALLVGAGRHTDADKAAAARRFSVGAAIALGVLATTGVVRAIDQVDGWDPLLDTAYGRLVLVKAALLAVAALLGGVNRWRSLPAVTTSFRGLRRVGTVELAVAAAVFVVTGFLTTAAPPGPTSTPGNPAPPVIVVDGADYATTMRVRLTASPGQAGQNRFTVRLSDYDTAQAIRADRVSARFRLPAHPETSETTLALPQTGPGTYVAVGGNLTLPGRWLVTVLVERGGESVELPLNLLTQFARPEVKVDRVPGQPTLYTGALSQERSVQVFVDPERPGATQLHVTFFGSGGGELPLRSGAITIAAGDRAPTTVTPRRIGPGHFVADVDAPRGPLSVEVTAVAADGEYLFSPVDVIIPG